LAGDTVILLNMQDNEAEHTAAALAVCQLPEVTRTGSQSGWLVPPHYAEPEADRTLSGVRSPDSCRIGLVDVPPGRAEIDAHRPHAQPLVRGHPLGLLAVGNHRPGPVGEVAQHHPAGLAGVRLGDRAGRAVVAG